MRLALAAAAAAPGHDDVPIGAVFARGGEPLATAGNERDSAATRPRTPRSSLSARAPSGSAAGGCRTRPCM